jgi:hypothetical protein
VFADRRQGTPASSCWQYTKTACAQEATAEEDVRARPVPIRSVTVLQLAWLPPLAEKPLSRGAVLPVRLVPRAKLFEQ